MATNTFTITIAATGAPPYGFDDTFGLPEGDLAPYPPLFIVQTGPNETVRCFGINDYGGASGIEMFIGDNGAGQITMPWLDITEIRLEHSGGTLILNSISTLSGGDNEESSGYETLGETYYWYPSVGGIWTVADVGQTYTVEIITEGIAEPAGDPDYNQGTVIVNPKNPGGGVPIPEAEYTTTQTAEVTGQSVKKGGGGGTGKGGGGGPPAEVIIDLPAQAGTFDLTASIEAYDFGSATWYLILAGANITAGGTRQRLKVSSSVADVVNASANDVLPYMWRVNIVHGDATAVTYSVEYKL